MSDDALERARRALAEAKADAAAKGARPVRRDNDPERLRGAVRHRRDDPQPLGTAIDGFITDRGWRQRAAVGGAFGLWTEIVGAELAAHAQPESYRDGELVVIADSATWATQLQLLTPQLVRRLNAELGDGTVRRVRVRGPSRDTGRRGKGWRVRDTRGPRDTYG